MNVKIEKLEKSQVKLQIEVEATKFEEGIQKSYIKNVKKFNIPGFRKGKAPRKVIERAYGEQVFFEDAINIVCGDAYDTAIEENDIHTVDRPDIDIEQIGNGQNLIFSATVTVIPDVELGQYKGIEVTKVDVIVTEDDIDAEIKKMQDKNSRLVKIEDRPVADGDTANIDYEGFVDEVPFEGGKGENHNLVIGSGQFIPGFEEQLIGVEAGAELDVNVTFPEEYHSIDLAGKAAIFKVKVNEIRAKELPELDDDFAKDVSEFDTLEELRADLRKKAVEAKERNAKSEQENELIKKIVENATIEVPQVMVEKQLDSIVRDYGMRLSYQGLDMDTYLKYTGTDMEAFRSQLADRALADVKTQLVLDAIRKKEAVEPNEQELDEELNRYAENYSKNVEEFKKHLRPEDIEYIKGNLAVSKTVDFLIENAKTV